MAKVFSFIMTTIFLFVVSQQAVIVMNFKLNQKAITEQFCINISKPELQCNGQCYLTKELQESEHTDSEKILNTKNLELVFYETIDFSVERPKEVYSKGKDIYIEFQHSEPYLEILVPPPMYFTNIKQVYI